MSFVLDASVAVAWAFSDQEIGPASIALLEVQRTYAIVPSLWHFEVASALSKATNESRLTRIECDDFLADLQTLDIRVYRSTPMIHRLLALAAQWNLTPYDASYLDLALLLNLPLATLDRKLATAVRHAGAALIS